MKQAVLAALAAVLFAPSGARAADEALIAAAKKEGSVMWYTTLIADMMARPAAAAFEKKYGIKVDFFRGDSSDLITRLDVEAKANKIQADLYDGTSGALTLKKAGFTQQWLPDIAARYPKQYVDPEGAWIAASLYIETMGFNTDLLKKDDLPKSYDDLLAPKWKNKLVMSGSVSAPGSGGFTGLVLTSMGHDKGLDYLRRLAGQNIAIVKASARVVLDQVIAGEYPLSLQILNHHVAYSSKRGAPVGWSPLNPSMAAMLVVGALKGPHPNAGRLLVDWLVSDEGQSVFRDADYIPASPAIKASDPTMRPDDGKFPVVYFPPEDLDRGTPEWAKIAAEVFR